MSILSADVRDYRGLNNELLALAVIRAKLAAERAQRPAVVTELKFRGASKVAQETTSREWLLSGPAETSKTTAGLWRLFTEASRTPHGRYAIVRKVRTHMDSTVLETWHDVIEMRGGSVLRMGGTSPYLYMFGNGAKVYVGGMDRPGKVLSGERDGIYVCQAEELDEADWATLISRATGRARRSLSPMVWGDCNPSHPQHWILRRAKKRLLLLESRHEDNPLLFEDCQAEDPGAVHVLRQSGESEGPYKLTAQGVQSMEALDSLPGILYDRLRLGLWVAQEGIVYKEFQRGVHLIAPFAIPFEWRRYRSIDFGYENPFTCGWWAQDPDGALYLYRETYYSHRTYTEHGMEIKERSKGERYDATISDHDAAGRADLLKCGISTIPADKDVELGIQAMRKRLTVPKKEGGRPRLFLFEGALVEVDPELERQGKPTCLLDEFGVYVMKKRSSSSAEGKPEPEEPVKQHDHGMDEARYLVRYVDKVGPRAGAHVAAPSRLKTFDGARVFGRGKDLYGNRR